MYQTNKKSTDRVGAERCGAKVSSERLIAILTDLVAIPTVNPMGSGYEGPPIERPVIEYLEHLFVPFDVQVERQLCSRIHESLLIKIIGRTEEPGTLLESHIDTVPAHDWVDRAFVPHVSKGQIFGRGACDDKASLATMVVALLRLLETGDRPPQPVWLLAAGDEEYGQTGIKQFLNSGSLPIGRCVVGEPTELAPVVQHKGTIRWDVTVGGRSTHTSQAELGHNAILDMLQVIRTLADYEQELRKTYTSDLMSGPSLTPTMINGGRTRNMVPDECTVAVDFRILPSMDPQQAIDEIKARLNALPLTIEHSDFQCFAPALNTMPDDPFVQRVAELCRVSLGHEVHPAGVPYSSDAGWIPRNIPTIVLGPGSIAQAHAIDEYVEIQQVKRTAAIYQSILLHDWSREDDGTRQISKSTSTNSQRGDTRL